jgi:hypothetical protein
VNPITLTPSTLLEAGLVERTGNRKTERHALKKP